MGYIMLTLSALLLAFDFSLNKVYQQQRGTKAEATLLFNAVLGLLTAVIFLAVNRFQLSFSAFSVIMAMIMSMLVMSYNIIGFRLLKRGSMPIYTMFLMIGGMVLPYVFGLIFLHEQFSVIRTTALVFIILGISLSGSGGIKANNIMAVYCGICFEWMCEHCQQASSN